jgi:hypothetical protein
MILDPVRVTAGARCDPKAAAAGGALLQQARAGLLATVVGREANPARVVRLSYERTYARQPESTSPAVRVDTLDQASAMIRAGRRGADLVARGFTADSLGTGVYFAPDAEVLLDQGFEAGYCFRAVSGRNGVVGLGFSPAMPRALGRIDIEGTLWIDMKARALRSLEYRYVGAGPDAQASGIGGDLDYQELSNGAVIVTQWSVRLLKVRYDSVKHTYSTIALGRLVMSEAGGVIAGAEWPDGTRWQAPLGSLEVKVTDGEKRKPAAGVQVRLRNSTYATVTGKDGVARFTDVLPGRYAIDVRNPELERLGFLRAAGPVNIGKADSVAIRSSEVVADTGSEKQPASTTVRGGRVNRSAASMPTMAVFAERACSDARTGESPRRWLVGQVVDKAGRGLDSARVELSTFVFPIDASAVGGFIACIPDDRNLLVRIAASRGDRRSADSVLTLRKKGVTLVRIVIPPN